MEHIAIDLGGRESQICIRSSEGTILEERRLATQELRKVFDRPAGRVLLETCTEAFAVAELAMELGHEVRVVPATLVRGLGVGSHGVKTDVKDARVLSEASCRMDLPSVHVPREQTREVKACCGMRDILVRSRTALVNSVRSWLRGRVRQAPTESSDLRTIGLYHGRSKIKISSR